MEWQKTNKETAAATYDSARNAYSEDGTLTEDGLRLAIEEAKKATKTDRAVSISDVADFSILKQAQSEMGIR
jgi:hypothetical protein